MQILVTGGVFNRADGLADEIKADLFAPSAANALRSGRGAPGPRAAPDVPEPGRRRKRKIKAVLPKMRSAGVAAI